jgi:hypothetical protein
MPLLSRPAFIRRQDLVDDPVNGSSLGRAGGRLRRYPGGTENASIFATVRGSKTPRRFPPAHTFNLNRITNLSVKLHTLIPRPLPLFDNGLLLPPDFYAGATGLSGRFSEGFLPRRLQ